MSSYLPEKDFPVFLIKSKWSLNSIREFVEEYGPLNYMRIIYDRQGRETDLTIAILSMETYSKLCDEGYNNMKIVSEFKISPYKLHLNNFPGEGKTENLFIPVSKSLGIKDDDIIKFINSKLSFLVSHKILPINSWEIKTPLISREKGGIKGGCFIIFHREVDLESKAMIRILLHDTYWDQESDSDNILKCYWARERTEKPPIDKDAKKIFRKKTPVEKSQPVLNTE